MNIGDLVVKVVYDTVDKASKAVEKLGETSDKTTKKTKTLQGAFKDFSGLGGPIGEIAGRVEDAGDKATKAASGFRTLSAALGGAVGAAAAITVALVAVAGAAGIVAAIRFAAVLDDIGDLAVKLGMSATQALIFKQEMDDAGVSIDAYNNGLQKLVVAMSKSADGSEESALALERLGVNLKENAEPQKVAADLAEKYSDKLKNGTITVSEMASLQTVLGKNYRETIVAIDAANTAQERSNELFELGIGISSEGLAATNDFSSANKELSTIFAVVGSQLVGEVVPAFTGLINAFVDSYKNGGLVKIAFDGIRFAAQLVMVPIRALFNIFIDLDAAITSAGKAVGAFFAALATRSTNPFKELKADLIEIWRIAESRKTGPWSWDSGKIEKPTGLTIDTSTSTSTPPKKGKAGKPTKAVEDPKGRNILAEWEEANEKAIESARKYNEQLAKTVQGYKDLADPAAVHRRALVELQAVYSTGALTQDEYIANVEILREKILALNGTTEEFKMNTQEQTEEFSIMQRVGLTAFSGLEDAFVELATTGKMNFKSLMQAVLADLARLMVQLLIIKPLMNAVMGGFGGGMTIDTAGIPMTSGGMNLPTRGGASGGTNFVERDMMTIIHKGEAVVPKKYNPAAGGSSTGGINQTNNINIQVKGGESNSETGQVISKAVVDTMKSLARGEIANARRPGGLLY